jgi:glutathione S-transferase
MEPVLALAAARVDHPLLRTTFRDGQAMAARLSEALDGQPYLLGARYSAVDLLLSSPFQWLPDAVPDDAVVRAWIGRCGDRPSVNAVARRDAAALAA